MRGGLKIRVKGVGNIPYVVPSETFAGDENLNADRTTSANTEDASTSANTENRSVGKKSANRSLCPIGKRL